MTAASGPAAATSPDGIDDRDGRVASPRSEGARLAAAVCAWCLLVLLLVNLVVGLGLTVVEELARAGTDVASTGGAVAFILVLAVGVAVVPVAVVGFPVGWLLAVRLRHRSERDQVLASALAGAVLAVVLMVAAGARPGDGGLGTPGWFAVFAAQGAVGAGGGRAVVAWRRARQARQERRAREVRGSRRDQDPGAAGWDG